MHRSALTVIALVTALTANAQEVIRTVRVPYDHKAPNGGSFELQYLLGAPFDAKKPTVIYITDGQQFQIQRTLMPKHQASLFGDRFNVVGITGRGASADVQKRVTRADGTVDWYAAYQLMCAAQWVDDIEAVRRDLLGDRTVMIYGRSGGGLLAHQYLAKYAKHVSRAFTQAAVNPFLESELHINPDRLARELAETDPALPKKLRELLERDPSQRLIILKILQRQNFFVPLAQLGAERARAINEIAAGNTALMDELRKKYQVDDSENLTNSARGIAIRVRLFEFFAPVANERAENAAGFSLSELQRETAQPLLDLVGRRMIDVPKFSFASLHDAPADVFLLAGRRDHTCDYRTQIALASYYPHHRLLIVDDDHVFHTLNDDGTYAELLQTVLLHGTDSRETRVLLQRIDRVVWRDTGGD